MNDALKFFSIAGTVLPLVQSIIRIVETFPNLSGPQKKAQAINLMGSIWDGVQSNPNIKIKEIEGIPFAVFEPFISLFIDTIVGVFNLTGIFTKGDK